MNDKLSPVSPVRTPAPYLGGKRLLAPTIIERIAETPHALYVEPFVGMGGVFFRRTLKPNAEVINDFSGDVVNLFRILQRHYAAFMDHMKYQLTSRREFERLKRTNPDTLTDFERAARFIYLQRNAYGGKIEGRNFGVKPDRPAHFDYSAIVPMLEEVYERLTGVMIENLDWAELLTKYDRDDALFYLDPPYFGNEGDYGKEAFTRARFAEMAAHLKALQGRAILSINDTPEVRQIFEGLRFEEVSLKYTIGQAAGGVKDVGELIIYNYERVEMPLFR